MSHKYICTLDYGNSKEKGALFENNKFLIEFSIKELMNIITQYNLNLKNTNIIFCSVKSSEPLKTNIPLINVKDFFKNKQFFDMPVSYSETLGMDRLVQAFYHFSGSDESKVIIDSGTFTTVDFVSEKGFLGGYILPGLEILKNSYKYGELLKTHNLHDYDHLSDIPDDTVDALRAGLHYSFISPLVEILLEQKFKTIVLTGGNTHYLKKYLGVSTRLKGFEISVDERLIHRSLKLVSERALIQ